MRVLFVHSHVFKYDQNGNYYSDGKLTYEMWKYRYLRYFKEVNVAARAAKLDSKELNLSSGPNVKHYILPNLSTIKHRYGSKKKLKKELESLIKDSTVLIARMPSAYAYQAIKIAKKLNKPYVVEVVGDVFTSLWTHGSPFGKILAPIYFIKYKSIIKQSNNLVYVTKNDLQKKYPSSIAALTTNISNVDIPLVPEEVLLNKICKLKKLDIKKEINIGLIGSYSSKYKGIDTAIRSIKILYDQGLNCNLYVLGDGNNKWLIELAEKLDIAPKVNFVGSLLGGEKVFKWLDSLDLYIQPSLTEGLPRSLIEAMSRGLPCVASSVGGIPELIEEEFIHKPKKEKDLSRKIEYLLKNKQVLIKQAEKNFSTAKNYTYEVLNARRKDFWNKFMKKELIKK